MSVYLSNLSLALKILRLVFLSTVFIVRVITEESALLVYVIITKILDSLDLLFYNLFEFCCRLHHSRLACGKMHVHFAFNLSSHPVFI